MGHTFWPAWANLHSGNWNAGSGSINAANAVYAQIIKAPKTGNIRSVWFAPQVGSNGTITIGIYQVDATTGDPANTPTPWATNTFVSKALTTGDNNDTVNSGNFTADAAVTRGQTLAVCYISPGASFGNILIRNQADAQWNFPYTDLFNGTSWSKNISGPVVALVYDDGSVVVPDGCYVVPGDANAANWPTTLSIGTGTTPDLFALRFQVPWFFRADAAYCQWDADGDINFKIVEPSWDETSSGLLATSTHDNDIRAANAGGPHIFSFDSQVILKPKRWYRLVVEPTTATTVAAAYHVLIDADLFAACPAGIYAHLSTGKTVTGDGDWTNYNNGTDGYRVPLLGLVGDFLPHPPRFVNGWLAR